MLTDRYDAIVIGARCAGSPTAMLLARQGHRVLLVDRATFPSDTISTHLIHPAGMAALARWGLRDRVLATNSPPIHTYTFDMGPFALSGSPGTVEQPVACGPRRTVLDKLLLDAAADAGVEVREGFVVDELVVDDGRVTGLRGHAKGGQSAAERARVVVGADGVHSLVATAASAETYQDRPPLQASYYAYWSGLPMDQGFEAYDRGDRAWAAWPTSDDLTLVIVGWPIAQFEANKPDFERHYLDAFERAPAFRDRVGAARREERFRAASVPNFFRKPFGPGWALVGDAGYTRDFITAQGISDAFLDAERLSQAVDEWLSGRREFDAALAEYHAARDARVTPMFHFTCAFATMAPPPPEMQQLFGAIHGKQPAMDAFCRMFGGGMSPAEFFSEANVASMLAG
jgi:2-polyprenyl-6-methoxyphenol hydroxylase-like FAD-dependent oxidoreductase